MGLFDAITWVVAVLFIPGIVGDFYILGVLADELCPIFDPKFRPNLDKTSWFAPSRTLNRANFYALWIVCPTWFRRQVKTAVGYDFRSQISSRTLLFCRLHTACFFYLVGFLMPYGVLVIIRDYFFR